MFLELQDLSKVFGGHPAVDGVSLAIPRGEILALLGPSGSGKTTTLRLLAGFETPDRGRVLVEGEDVTRVAPVHRRFGMVFQHYALFPHLDVGENVAFGLESLRVKGEELRRRVSQALALVDLAGFERRRIGQLSGGQQQRVALARALAPEPRVLLLDEPLSNLDPSLRERTRREIRELIHRVGITTVLVTHEQEEAFDLADRIAVLRDGRLEQCGTADDLYDHPATRFVAGFIGRTSTLPVTVTGRDGDHLVLSAGPATFRLPDSKGLATGSRAVLLARPEAFVPAPGGDGLLEGTVSSRRFVGGTALFTVDLEGAGTLEIGAEPRALAPGQRVSLVPTGRGLHLFPADGS